MATPHLLAKDDLKKPVTDPHVCIEIPLVVLPYSSCDGRPWAPECEDTLDTIALEQCTLFRLKNAWLDSKEWHCGASWFGGDGSREGGDHDGTSLSLPERVDDGTLFLSNVFIVPVPGFGINGLADRSEDPQRGEVVVLDMLMS